MHPPYGRVPRRSTRSAVDPFSCITQPMLAEDMVPSTARFKVSMRGTRRTAEVEVGEFMPAVASRRPTPATNC